jgi:VanZ family protein
MERRYERGPQLGPGLRWLVWGGFLVAWTIALLTTPPVHVAEAVLPPPARFPSAKLLHVSAYAILVLLSSALPVTRRVRWLLLLLLSLHAMGTEFLQQFVPERGPSLVDVGIDHIGLAIGLALCWRWW